MLSRLMQQWQHPHAPGVVVAHSAASSGIYIGSPSITQTSNGVIFVAHDEFGPKSNEHIAPITR